MQTFNINPVVSYQIVPNVAFAAGVNFLILDATLEKYKHVRFRFLMLDKNSMAMEMELDLILGFSTISPRIFPSGAVPQRN